LNITLRETQTLWPSMAVSNQEFMRAFSECPRNHIRQICPHALIRDERRRLSLLLQEQSVCVCVCVCAASRWADHTAERQVLPCPHTSSCSECNSHMLRND